MLSTICVKVVSELQVDLRLSLFKSSTVGFVYPKQSFLLTFKLV